jgi:hypothetical protein
MSQVLDLQEKIKKYDSLYHKGELSKEEYLELLQDIDTSKIVAEGAHQLEDLSKLNHIIINTIKILKVVA